MRKLFVIEIVIVVLGLIFLGFTFRYKEEDPTTQLTVELLNQMTSWEELLDTVCPIAESCLSSGNEEDRYCIHFIIKLNTNTNYDELYSKIEKLEGKKKVRLKKKFKTIKTIYNSSDHFGGWIYSNGSWQ